MASNWQSSSLRFMLSRRDWLTSSGAAAFGWPLLSTTASATQLVSNPRAKSVILIYLPGGLAQHDSFDLKPEAPVEIRGEFQPIATEVPGMDVCELLPKLARRTKQFALVRTMSHKENNHFPATHYALTGHVMPRQLPGDAVNAASRHDWPSYGSACDYVQPRNDGIPNSVALPGILAGGATMWPGQNSGFLSPRHDPWQVNRDPNQKAFREETLEFPTGVTIERVNQRQRLLKQLELNRQQCLLPQSESFDDLHQSAVTLLTSGRMAQAFQIENEPDRLRDNYGRHTFGQSLLLARRLVQAGVKIVQANMGPVQTWDTHEKNFVRLRDELLPKLDQALSALLDDLSESGLLEETMIVMTGEFGRTPAISTLPGAQFAGRNHWAHVYTALFAGAGVQHGQVIGRSDAIGAYPATRSYSPDDLGTTLFEAMGLAATSELRDQFGRPMQLASGQVIDELYGS